MRGNEIEGEDTVPWAKAFRGTFRCVPLNYDPMPSYHITEAKLFKW